MKDQKQHIVLSAKDLSIGYTSKKQLNIIASDITMQLEKGNLIGLIGINGSGKSTLLRTLSGLQIPLSGKVMLENKSLSEFAPLELATKLSVVLTKQGISKNLSVSELIALGRQPYTNWIGTLSEKDKDTVVKALHLTETYELKDKKCYELSDGQLQRVLIARALAQDTKIILLDEPMTHLDLHHKAALLKLLVKITQEQKKTIVFSTHDIEYALKICDKIYRRKKSFLKNPNNSLRQTF